MRGARETLPARAGVEPFRDGGPDARLVWPVYPFDPYANGFERDVQHAVGALSVPLKLTPQGGRYARPNEQEIRFEIEAP